MKPEIKMVGSDSEFHRKSFGDVSTEGEIHGGADGYFKYKVIGDVN